MLSNKILNPTVTELFITGRKLSISLIFTKQSYFCSKKYQTKFNTIFCHKIPNKIELQQIAFNHSSDIELQDFMNLYKMSTTEPYSFLYIETTLPLNNSLRFRKNFLETR